MSDVPFTVDLLVQNSVNGSFVEGCKGVNAGERASGQMAKSLDIIGGTQNYFVHTINTAMHSEEDAHLLEASCGQISTCWQFDDSIAEALQVLDNCLDPVDILWVLIVVVLVSFGYSFVQRPVDRVRLLDKRLEATIDECFPQPLWVEGKVRDAAESAEALSHNTPLLLLWWIVRSQRLTDSLTVSYDTVGSKQLEVLCLYIVLSAQAQRTGHDRCAEASTSLVEVKHLVAFVQDSAGERVSTWMSTRTSGATVQKDHPWQLTLLLVVFAVVCGRLMLSNTTSENTNGPSIGL